MDDSGNNGDGHDIGASDDARDANDTNDINDPTGQADAARTEDTHGRGSADGATVAPGNAADAATENGHRPVTPAVIRQMMATTKTTNVYDSGEPMKQRQGNGTRDATEYTSIAHVARFTRVEHIGRVERGRHFIKPDGGPTPKMMPLHRHGNRPTKFATLQMQEFPVVREYSAGGLIFDEHQRVAIIARHSRSGHIEWCLPKGHIEKGETPEQTAVREVHEETGILGEVIDSIATIDYWFTGTEERIHKLVHHFALRQIGGELSVEGDPDHEAEDADWVDFKDLNSVLSYPNERKIAWLYSKKLNRQAKG
ncbi:NUDIX hydrolase [Bifidobacterium sp. ESL0763]|uniref:NUDIX hydrolase n=1 Tax=Bifidobacterium sp. ESL0763 TaxID=2983227 RepID=UPI0035A99742